MHGLEIFAGITYLFLGGDLLVRGSVALARKSHVSPMLVGLTIVAFGTSAPELLVSLRAAFTGHASMALGNVVGSNIANVLFVVGAPAIIYPMACDQPSARRNGMLMLAATAAFVGLCWLGPLSVRDGVLLLAGLVAYLTYQARGGWLTAAGKAATPEERRSSELERGLGLPVTGPMIGLFLLLGTIGLPLGAELTVHGAAGLAEVLGVGEAVIGLTIVAIGTSLPELATTIVAAVKHEADVAVGNVLGSNLLNLLAIGGVLAVVSPSPVPVQQFLGVDLPMMLAAAAMLAFFTWRRMPVGRMTGIVLVGLYGAYIFSRVPIT